MGTLLISKIREEYPGMLQPEVSTAFGTPLLARHLLKLIHLFDCRPYDDDILSCTLTQGV